MTWGKRRYVNPYHMAIIWLGIGDKDQIFAWVRKSLPGTVNVDSMAEH